MAGTNETADPRGASAAEGAGAWQARDSVALGLLLVASALLLAGWFDAPIHRPQDEGQLLVYPELILRGWLPQREFFTSYPPGVFWFLAAAYEWFGASVAVERSVGLCFRLAIIAGVFGLARRLVVAPISTLVATLCSIASLTMFLPLRLDAYAWLGGLAFVVLGLWCCLSRRRALWSVGGGCAGLALWFRLDIGMALLLGLAPLWHRASGAQRSALAIGIALGLVPLAIHVVLVSPQEFVTGLLVEPILHIAPQRRVGLGELGSERVRQLVLVIGGAVLAGFAASRSRDESGASWSVAGLAFGLLPQALQRMDEDHLLYVGCVVAGLAPAALVASLAPRVQVRAGVAFAAALTLGLYVGPTHRLVGWLVGGTGPTRSILVERGNRAIPVATAREHAWLSALADELAARAEPGQRLFIGPSDLSRTDYADLQLYFLFPELAPASYLIEMNPGSADRPGSRLASDLVGADWLVTTPRWQRMAGERSWQGSVEAQTVVEERFEAIGEFGPWRLQRKRRGGGP